MRMTLISVNWKVYTSPLSAIAFDVFMCSHLWHVLNPWLASVFARKRPVICNSDHLCGWNSVLNSQLYPHLCSVSVSLTWRALSIYLCGSGSEEPVWSEPSINIWWSRMWFCQVPPCSLTTSYLHFSCAHTDSLILKVTLPPSSFDFNLAAGQTTL